MGRYHPWIIRVWIVIVFVAGNLPITVQAQSQPADPPLVQEQNLVQVQNQADQVTITWPNPDAVVASASVAISQLPLMRYQGYELPMQLFTVALSDGSSLRRAGTLKIEQLLDVYTLVTEPWQGTLTPAAPLEPRAIGWEALADPLIEREQIALPTSPLILLREGFLHGERIAVLALSPLYQDGETIKLATTFSANIAHATQINPSDYTIPTYSRTIRQSTNHRAFTAATELEPTNPDAAKQAIKFMVSTAGMQIVTGAQLDEAGFDLTTLDPSLLQLRHNGNGIAMEIDGIVGDRLFADSTLRFYAPLGTGWGKGEDRWNPQAIYWLTIGESAGLRMANRSVAPGSAPTRDNAMEYGHWEDNVLYDSRYAGFDRDHWYHQKLLFRQTPTAELEKVTIDTKTVLPRIDGTATYTFAVTTNVRSEHTLRVIAADTTKDVTWNSVSASALQQDWQRPVTTTVRSDSIEIGLLNALTEITHSDPSVLLDKVFWQQPVELAFGQAGGAFVGIEGMWRYTWSELPAEYRFYDISDPNMPIRLSGATASGFEDGPTVHRYYLAAANTLHSPIVQRHDPVGFTTTGADAIYITAATFVEALEPLLELRRDQGYQVVAIDVQDIYDAWGYGHVSPDAIRNFLRYAYTNWTPTPYAVVLVGDGTWDPYNYEEKGNINFIPPYLADVDPWLGEAACENCYVQLNGDDPVTGDDPNKRMLNPEMWIGRFPVKSAGEVANVVQKIIRYETFSGVSLWQGRLVFVADNYIRNVEENGNVIVDLAGDFAKHANSIADLSPSAVRNDRIFYDPYPEITDPAGEEPWRIADATAAFNAVINNLSAGAGAVIYNGHSHQWQWAVTDEDAAADPDYLLSLYDPDRLRNQDSYFINLSMTCLTGQFPKPATSGTVLDERMFLNPTGGAIAVWGPAGLSVAYGHDFLQRGFFNKLWSSPPESLRVGELLEAGYTELLNESTCCEDTAKTFLLLGDPLTTARIYPNDIYGLYLPIIDR